MRRICVVGAGVIGLSTAVRLLEDWPPGSCHVTVMADAFNEDTTSDGAFGFWMPNILHETPPNDIKYGYSKSREYKVQLLIDHLFATYPMNMYLILL